MYHKIALYDDNETFFAVSGITGSRKTIGKGDTPEKALEDWLENEDL